MAQKLTLRLKNQLHALWKYGLSIRKRNWELDDYPVVINEQEVDPANRYCRYTAFIVNWGLAGGGNTETEALQCLDKNLATAEDGKGGIRDILPSARQASSNPICLSRTGQRISRIS
jgi:hypothetical protein